MVLGTVLHLVHQPRPHHADVGLAVAVEVVHGPSELGEDGANQADQGQGGKPLNNADIKEDNGVHDEEQNCTIHPVFVEHNGPNSDIYQVFLKHNQALINLINNSNLLLIVCSFDK